ncbi:MAG: 1-acyl-sn-glycerol-3-phosphate acyltransferase [Rhizobiales bacterium 65-9]|nr:1-acyl-sn-glycerol-3-phosphate acyltransferase [Hyphomicrobiales bacterium]OJY36475.1 MAG: 1-acyl-sn-glycerol-3-phosphate acyltransferase [Rhizobiales bacterium 65-9]
MIFLRSLLFNAAFYANMIVWMILILPSLALPRAAFFAAVGAWVKSSLWLLRVIAGVRVEIRNPDKIPKGPAIVAAKHQSFLETFALVGCLGDPVIILKRELTWIPLFGWYLRKARMVPVDRGARGRALDQAARGAREEMAKGRQLLIFPEGTRRPPGATPAYKYGVAYIYDLVKFPVTPVGLNTGLFWPRRAFIRRPGVATIEFLDPIPAGLGREEALAAIQAGIERSSDRLLQEGLRELGPLAPRLSND